ncbi:MAG TPA: hypothetical protein ENI61_01100 [Ignavibacteria bacterium]|nr:hypothetical protein [Ignavibacteria bacterium]
MRSFIKNLAYFFVLFLFCLFVGNTFCSNKIFEEIKITNVSELHTWIVSNLKYIIEKPNDFWAGQEWKMAIQTYRDGGGDCEDLATFNFEMLKRLGYNPILVLVWYTEREIDIGHAIVIFKEVDGKFGIFSNLDYEKTSFTNRYQVLQRYYPTKKRYIMCDQSLAIFCGL